MSVTNGPASELATNDPGDDIARRYRYQWTWAAISCCALLDDTHDVLEIFCEHHEDILIRHKNDTFSGLQIKTKATGENGWDTGDEAVRKSFARFCQLEEKFPNRFTSFKFLTNHPLRVTNNGKDVRHVISEIVRASETSTEPAKTIQSFIKAIAQLAKCDINVARRAIEKASADDSLPKLQDIEMRLITTLTGEGLWPKSSNLVHAAVLRVARHLVNECGRASSLAHEDTLPGYLPIVVTNAESELEARIEGKRIDIHKLLAVLDDGMSDTLTLDGPIEKLPQPGIGSQALLRAKLDAGGFSATSLYSAEDLRDKAEYLGIVWSQKFGETQGLQRYGHIRSLVLADAAKSFEATKTTKGPMGVPMLSQLMQHFSHRRSQNEQLFGCSDLHLQGVAYSLTSECKIQWSVDRPWETEE